MLKMDNSGFEVGMRVHIALGTHNSGQCGTVIGNEAFIKQWWCPILWDDAKDPIFHKSICLEPLGGMEPEDWRELLHMLTKMQAIASDNPDRRQDCIMTIMGKIESGKMDGLDTDELGEIHRLLRKDAADDIYGGVRLRTIAGKIGPNDDLRQPVLQAISREELLARCYNMAPSSVAEMCDKELDRSGALLGRVRNLAAKVVKAGAAT